MNSCSGTSRRIRKAFLPGAGLGTRLRPLTDKLPKPLVPFYHEPLVCQALRRCKEAGITDVMINTHHLPEMWDRFFPEHEWEGIRLSFSYEPVLLDTGGGIRNIESWIDGEPFLVCNADNLTDFSLERVIKEHFLHDRLATLVLREEGYNRNVAFDHSTGVVTDMRHRLGVHPGTHQFTGMYCLSPEILDYIPDGEIISIVETFLHLIPEGQIGGLEFNDGHWIDISDPEVYIDAHNRISGQKIHPEADITPGAEIDDLCVIGPGAKVPGDAHLSNCIVWPGVAVPEGTVARRRVFTG